MSNGKITLSDVTTKIEVSYNKVLDIKIINKANEHGRMILVLEVPETTDMSTVQRIRDTQVTAFLPEDKVLFCGLCTNILFEEQGGYKKLGLEVRSNTYLADKNPRTQTFQRPSKKLSDIVQEVLDKYQALYRFQKNPVIKTVVYQQNETDWTFIKRIANQHGQQVYVNARSAKMDIVIGTAGMQNYPESVLERMLEAGKDISELRQVMNNVDSSAASYQFGSEVYLCSELAAIPGDTIGREIIAENMLVNTGGILENRVRVAKTAETKASYQASTHAAFVSNIITGKVIAVDGTNIQVQFDADAADMAGNCVDVPYESSISNSFYCMPDEGDQVFIYYENNGKIICLGSKRSNTDGTDYDTPEEKVLTVKDKMIRFTSRAVKLTDTRQKHDDEDDTEISIILDDEDGITITSGSDIIIESKDGGSIEVHAQPSEEAIVDAQAKVVNGRRKFQIPYSMGRTIYALESGMDEKRQSKCADEIEDSRFKKDWDASWENAKDALSMKDLRNEIWRDDEKESEKSGNVEDKSSVEKEETQEQYDTGVVTIYGLNAVTMNVDQSFLIIDSDIFVNAPEFRWLGYTKTKHEAVIEEYQDECGMLLDSFQFVLDACGLIPVYGAFFDIASAVVSWGRGDYGGAIVSVLGAIPGLGDACIALKLGGKGCKALEAISKVGEVLSAGNKLGYSVKFFYNGTKLANQGVGTWNDIQEVKFLIENEDFEWNNPNDKAKVINILRNIVGMIGTVQNISNDAKTFKNENGGGTKGDSGDNGNTSKKPTDNDDGKTTKKPTDTDDVNNPKKPNSNDNNPSKKRQDEGPDNEDSKCTTDGDPIDVVTGSLVAEYVDICLEDVLGKYLLKRHYQSAYNNRGGILGDKWRYEIESRIVLQNDIAVLQMPDLHMEQFRKTEENWHNLHTGDESLTLSQTVDGYLLHLNKTGETYEYGRDGYLSAITDIHGNTTTISYMDGVPVRLTVASGQWLEFRYENGKVIVVRDNMGREVRYTYQNNFISSVKLANGGSMRYTYTKEGYLSSFTDLNNRCFAKNFFDRNGRVIRQELSGGEEYVMFYDDVEKQNTFLTTSNGENIIYAYGREKLVTEIRYPDKTTEHRRYDEGRNLIYEKDRLGRETYRIYNPAGQVIEERMPDGLIKSYAYNDRGLLLRTWDNAGRETKNEYDTEGNLLARCVRIDEKNEQVTSYTYDSRGRILTVTDANGGVETYRYDSPFFGATRYETASGAIIYYEYDEGGRLMEVTNAYGKKSYGYNAFGHRIISRDAEGNVTRYYYDNMANLTKEIRPNGYNMLTDDGIGTEYIYDVWSHVTRMVTPDGGVYIYENDFNGNVRREIGPKEAYQENAKGMIYEYDADGNRIRTIYPDGTTLREMYDACGNVVKRILPEAYDNAGDDGTGYSYTYDEANRLQEIRDPYGVVECRYVYDLAGNVIKNISAKGYLMGDTDASRVGTLYTYDLRGKVTSVRRPLTITPGEKEVRYQLTTFRYDKVGNCVEEKRFFDEQTRESAAGKVNVIHYTYDSANRLTHVNDSSGAHTQYEYNERNQRTMEKRKIAEDTWQEWHYEYSPAGNMIRMAVTSDEKGCGRKYVSTRYTYDGNGNVTRIQTPSGNEILREYDLCDRLVAETYKEKNGGINNRTTYKYDTLGNLTERQTESGYTLHYDYDIMNRLTTITDSDGGVERMQYDKNGNLITHISPQENATLGANAHGYRYTYDMLGRNTEIETPEGIKTRSVTYNIFGETEHEGDGIGGVTLTYDFAGRRTGVITDGGRAQEYTYDARGNIIGLKDGNGGKTFYITDLWGRITELTQPNGVKEQYEYDHAGNLIAATDGNGNTVTYRYNNINQMAVRADASGAEEHFYYDKEGWLCEHHDRDGRRSIYRYNMYGSQTLHENSESGLRDIWEYDCMGRLKSAIGGGMRYEYEYYANGSLKEKKASGRTLLAYAYDLDGNKIRKVDLTGKETSYAYDHSGQLTEVSENGKVLATYRYQAEDLVSRLTIGTDLTTEYAYDIDRNLKSIKTLDGTKILVDNNYSYDGNANRIRKEALEGLTRYSYDANNRLVEVQYPDIVGNAGLGNTSLQNQGEMFGTGNLGQGFCVGNIGNQGRFERLTYDAAGNRIRQETEGLTEQYRYDNCNRLMELTRNYSEVATQRIGREQGIGCQGVSAEVSPRQKTFQFTYDRQGNMLSDGNNTYVYDGFSRVSEVALSDGRVQKNHYDAEGLRHEMEENGKLVKFLFNENKEVEAEEEGDGNIIRYIRGLGLISSDSENAKTYYHYVSDEQKSVIYVLRGEIKDNCFSEILDVEQAENNILNHYEYDAFGNTVVCEEQVHNRFRYNGQQFDPMTSQYYLRARFYNPIIGRFTQEDTYYGDGLNLYQYCASNPVMYEDPSGYGCKDNSNPQGKNQSDDGNKPNMGNDSSQYMNQLNHLPKNKIHHIIEGSKKLGHNHKWECLVQNKDWNEIKKIICNVMEKGQEYPSGSARCKVMEMNGYQVEVRFIRLPDGTIKISDAFVK